MNLLMIGGDRSLLAGKEAAFHRTLTMLRTHFDRIDILCPRVRHPRLTKRDDGSFPVFENVFLHPSPRGLWYQPFWIAKRGRSLIATYHHGTATVHDYPPFYNGLGAWMLRRRTSIPTLTEVHHLVGRPIASDWKEWIGALLSRLVLPWEGRWTTTIRIVNAHVRKTLLQWGIAEAKLVLAPSFYLKRSEYEDTGGERTVDLCTAARLVANKGIDLLFRAIALIPSVHLVIVGDGPDRTRLQQLARSLRIDDRVEFRGWLGGSRDVRTIMSQSKIFAMTSLSEGGPRSALEAMASGCAVIATGVGVMPDVVEDGVNGLLTKPYPDAIAQCINRLMQNPAECEAMGNRARAILDRFDAEVLMKGYVELIKSTAMLSANRYPLLAP